MVPPWVWVGVGVGVGVGDTISTQAMLDASQALCATLVMKLPGPVTHSSPAQPGGLMPQGNCPVLGSNWV